MTYVLVTITIEDLEKWKAGFREAGALRKSFGSKGVRAFTRAEHPNEIVILGEYEDAEKARQMFQSPEFREATKRAGLTAPPVVSFLEPAVELPA
jgi:uncharacterized protein (DUF1330 family)